MFKQLHFYGGVHPDERKLTNEMPIKIPPLLEKYIVPLQQHIGAPAKPVVEKGAHVLKGDLLAEAGGFVSARIHSPTSGTVSALTTCLALPEHGWMRLKSPRTARIPPVSRCPFLIPPTLLRRT